MCPMETDSIPKADNAAKQQQIDPVTSLGYAQAIVNNKFIQERQCERKLLLWTWRRARPVRLLTGIYTQLFKLIYTVQMGHI
jgi:hypothetical protein